MANQPVSPDISGLSSGSVLYKLYVSLYDCMRNASAYTPPVIDPDDPALQDENGVIDGDKVQNTLKTYNTLVMQNIAFGIAESISQIIDNQNNTTLLPFEGFVDNVGVSEVFNPNDGGKIYYVLSAQRFVYYREEDVKYCSMWNGYERYVTLIEGVGTLPKSNVLFVCDNILYMWNNNTMSLVAISTGVHTDNIDIP